MRARYGRICNLVRMTLAQAEKISSLVAGVVGSKGHSGFCRRSQFGGCSLVDISNAIALVIAKNRQVAYQDANARRRCREYADKAGALVVSLRMVVIPDAEAEKLSRLDRNSAEYKAARGQLLSSLLDDNNPEWQRFLKLEALDSFDNYCWTLDSADPLYWQKVYTHLDLAYDETSQVGEPETALDDRGNLAWQVQSVKEKRKLPYYQVLLWTACAFVLIWLLVKFAK